jgi:hypothetical protein
MASSFSTDLKLELMVTGENAGTWGDKTNTNLNLVQQAIAGFQSISIAGGAQTTALTMDNAALSNARNAVVKLTGTISGNQIVTVPTGIEKTYIVQNGTVGAFTVEFKQAGGTGTTFSATDKSIKIVFADGTNINTVDLDTLSGQIATAQLEDLAVTSGKLASFAVTSARLASFAVTSAKLASFAVTTARLATNAVTAIKITQSTITQSKLAANSVGANQLISTGVTAASYTAASITVDADGRITAASSGSGGAGMGIPTLVAVGPASGTYTASPTANRIGVYMYAGGGGGGGFYSCGAGTGGNGGFGFFNVPIAAPYSKTYAVGGGGSAGGPVATPGSAGGNTNLTDVGTMNGGNGGTSQQGGQAPGNPGNSPGITLQTARGFMVGINPVAGNVGIYAKGAPQGATGGHGILAIFENTGT